jgi:putative ABC transport system substrate-binding protein
VSQSADSRRVRFSLSCHATRQPHGRRLDKGRIEVPRALAFGVVGVAALAMLCDAVGDACAQASGARRIGWLSNASEPSGTNVPAGDFQQGLRDLGHVVGKNVVIEFRYADGRTDRLPDLAAELARLPVDVIVTSGESAALAARRTTKSLPIVATEFALDPVKAGLVASLGRPEGNVTGLASISEDLWQKRLALLKDLAPKITVVTVVWNPDNPGNTVCVDELKAASPGLGVQIRALAVRDRNTLDQALAGITPEPTGAVAICWDSVTLAHAKAIADFALARRMPTLAPLKEYADAGALLSYGASLPAQRRRAAYYVSRILKGAKPSDLPVERPTVFELVVNLRTAKALGLGLPPGIALLADALLE